MSLLDQARKNAKENSQNQEATGEVFDCFLQEKPVLILEAIYDSSSNLYMRNVASIADTTYAHAVKSVNKLENLGLVNTEKKGRKKYLFITEDGELVAEKLVELDEALDKVSEEVG